VEVDWLRILTVHMEPRRQSTVCIRYIESGNTVMESKVHKHIYSSLELNSAELTLFRCFFITSHRHVSP
jgi:hypothetical protein